MDERELIYDWNRAGGEGGAAFDWSRVRVDLNDETLRDGLQSPSVHDPAVEVKKRLLHLMRTSASWRPTSACRGRAPGWWSRYGRSPRRSATPGCPSLRIAPRAP